MTENKAAKAEDESFLNDFAGAGLDAIDQTATSMAYLSMVQPGSQAETDGADAGTWRNTATNDNYGKIVSVVPLAFKTIWNVRNNEAPFNTIAKYEPGSIEIDLVQPKNGKGYPKMIDKATGLEVQELYVYAVLIKEHPEAGVLLFSPTVSSLKTCRSWNTQLRGQILPNGAQAPIFAYSWQLVLDLTPNPKKPTTQMAKLIHVQKDTIIGKELFGSYVKPQLSTINSSMVKMLGDTTSDDAAE